MVDFSGCLGSSTLEGDMEAIETTSSGTQMAPAWLQLWDRNSLSSRSVKGVNVQSIGSIYYKV